MGVRTVIPSSISFTVELRCSTEKRYRVSVTLDLQERYIFLSSGILVNVSDSIEEFVSQLSEIASNQLALFKWDGTSDLTTEYQIVRVLPGYQIERSLARFNIVVGNGSLIQVEELHNKVTIQL
ncbi:hypothetical protein C7B65_13560 [Phormidesmis priestleyi ULC007]|uniref:Uncharacterized protein n=1 Tax=Phormidesmis priestleyi ULC007 TaxID=1920490 RepID=A0A2T1DE60_9CYAN|nr:hypothetical protein [Phormidesmis priestleyi]PSB18800.1 hypothetical protein C7B65_13560 [Phormidesmis priestleyi ULC007]PZO51061.1 MAG: hypothetical protein DCF14_10255 [Phormidesmis priestleyi]